MDDYRRASSALDVIEALAREAGKEDLYREFLQHRRGNGAVIDVGECKSS